MAIDFGVASPKDLPQLVELLGHLFAQEAEFQPDADKQKRALAAILANPSIGTLYVAREGRRPVAMASLLYTISTAEGGKAALFEDLIVDPKHRRKGVGSKLVNYVIQQARAEGVLRITLLTDLENDTALELYRKLGFVDSPMKPMRLHLKP
jgi:GNAT superfamily N-acetyltransferase